MDDTHEQNPKIIDFADKKAQKEEKTRLDTEALTGVDNFLSWAYNAARPKDSENNPIKTDEFRARWNNKTVRGILIYERSFDEKRGHEEETVSFTENGEGGRVLLRSVENNIPTLWCYKNGPDENTPEMTLEEIMQFLKDLGAPHEPSDPFPFAPNLRSVK